MGEHLKKTIILVVDDNEANRYMLSRALKRAGYEVIEASDGEDALRLVQQRPDLITLDVHLPDISGIDVCRKIKSEQELRAIPVIHISATFVQNKDKVNALNSGADGYLTQPLEDVVLVATVKAFLRAKTLEKEREELLIQSRLDLEALRTERDVREKFVATLSHDLRTPMTTAKMSAQLILKQPNISETTHRLVERVKNSIERADQMIRDLLDANRIRAGETLPLDIKECNLREVVEHVISDLNSTHGDRFIFNAPTEVIGSWDCNAIKRIIENLTANAIKYGADRPITVSIAENKELVEIAVHNEGNPLSSNEQMELFRPYVRSASALQSGQKGWGLGLTLVKGMAEAHGGEVRVESSQERGTTFTVSLPRRTVAMLQMA